eukprot:3360069-Pyramimonas_sp.AAC.1
MHVPCRRLRVITLVMAHIIRCWLGPGCRRGRANAGASCAAHRLGRAKLNLQVGGSRGPHEPRKLGRGGLQR